MGALPPVLKAFLCASLFYSHRDENKMDLCACASARAQIARALWTNLPICLSVFIGVEKKRGPAWSLLHITAGTNLDSSETKQQTRK